MPFYGYPRSSPNSPNAGRTGNDDTPHYRNQIYSVFPPVSGHQWAYRWNMHVGKGETATPTVQGGVQFAEPDGNPETTLVRTDAFTVTTPMSSGADGAISTRDLQSVLRLFDGRRYSVGGEAHNARVRYGMRAAGIASQPDDANNLMYYRDSPELPPTDGWTASSYEGWLAVWLDSEPNYPPEPPAVTVAGASSLSASSPSQIGTFTPTIIGTFRDDNEVVVQFGIGEADKLKKFQIQVYNHETGVLRWDSNSLSATSTEQQGRQFNRAYAGATLSAGFVYRVRCRVWDQFDAGSDWSAWRYFIIGAGSMDDQSTPIGLQNTQTPGPFVATWRHTGGLSTNAVQVRIREADSGSIVRDSGTIAKTVADDAVSSVTWAQTGFAALPWDGNDYTWEMRGRDTANAWGSWVAQQFWMNAAPTTPANVAPDHNGVVTSRPKLAVTVSDKSDPQSALTVKFRIKNAAGTVLFTRTATRNVSNGRFEYQTTSTDLATFGTFRWDAYSYDGVVYSGGTTVEANADKSAQRTFIYAQGPSPTITSPTDGGTIETATPRIEWTVTGQVKRTVTVRRGDLSGPIIHTSAIDFMTNSLFYDLPANLSTGEALEEGDVLLIRVIVTDSNGITGTDTVTVTVDFPNPPALDLSADLAMAEGDGTASFVRLSWPQSSYPISDEGSGAFQYYWLVRRPTADALANDPTLPDESIRIAKIWSVTQTHYDDHTARPGVEYVWTLRHYILVNGVSLLSSVNSNQVLRVDFEGTIIHDARDPLRKRIVLAARKERTIRPINDIAVLMPWGQSKPLHLHGETYYNEIDCEYSVVAESPAAASAIIRRAQQMAKDGGPLHYRDGRGNSFWGEFAEPPVEVDTPGGAPRRLRVKFRELAYAESVTESEED